MAKKSSTTRTSSSRAATEPLRFAHPFFTTIPAVARAAVPGVGTRMLDFIAQNLHKVPKAAGDSVMKLSEVIGATGSQAIEASGRITFHAVGDTGRGKDTPQEEVADAMAKDYDSVHPDRSPAFFLHLGDVIYGHDKNVLYRREFYEPYMHYPGKIIAIPGNHDGEVFPQTDPVSLRTFLANFCADSAVVPPIAGTIFRQTMTQPGVYWLLDAPFVHIVGLYSNSAENPGFISGTIPGSHQKKWLVKTLKKIKAGRTPGHRKALVIAVHHPPFTSGGHSPSAAMLADIDDACAQAGIQPDMVLSAHSHNYQRYTRTVQVNGAAHEIPYLVAGCGGINNAQVTAATGQQTGDHVFVKSRKGFGYLLVTAAPDKLSAKMVAVDDAVRFDFDQVSVDLNTNRVS